MERISAIELTGNTYQFKGQHKESETDIFGFAANGESHEINLSMSLRAYLFLKEEYPRSIPYVKHDKKENKYTLRAKVNSLLPLQRFMKGLEGEVNKYETT